MERKRRFGDRWDGYRLRGMDPMFGVLPYIMKKRNESAVAFEFELDITNTERFLREKRMTEYPGLSYTHLFWAAMVRGFALTPKTNRFVAGRRVYARKYIRLSMAVKQNMTSDAKEYQIVADFEPTDTLYDVARKIDQKLAEVRETDNQSSNATDNLINIVMRFPRPFLSVMEKVVQFLDFWGMLPKSFAESTPFYSSAYISNMGSLGADAVYHHLYELGTTTMFVSFGRKETRYQLQKDGSVAERRVMKVKFVVDERICDGFNYAMGFNCLKEHLENPALLMEPPKYIPEDDEIDRKPRS